MPFKRRIKRSMLHKSHNDKEHPVVPQHPNQTSGRTEKVPGAALHADALRDDIKPLTQVNELWTEDIAQSALSGPERVPELPARRMIKLAGLLDGPSQPMMIMDNAAGGSLLVTELLFDMLPQYKIPNLQVLAADVSRAAVCDATRKLETMAHSTQIMTIQMDMQNMEGMCNKDFTHVLTNFGISLAPDTDATLDEIKRVLKPGGICGFTTWIYLSWICLLRSAIATIPGAPRFPTGHKVLLYLSNQKPWHCETFIHETLDKAGFVDVQIEEFTAFHAFTKHQFIETFGGAVTRYLTRRIYGKEAADKFLHKIPAALSRYLDEHHPGGIELEMRSLIVVAKKKSGKSGRGGASSKKASDSPSAEVEEVKRLSYQAEVPHY